MKRYPPHKYLQMNKTSTNMKKILFLSLMTAALVSCNDQSEPDGTDHTRSDSATAGTGSAGTEANAQGGTATAVLSGTYGDTTVSGSARFTQDAAGQVRMVLDVTIPAKANQELAVHLHQNGSCADTAKAAGPHWNPTQMAHGQWQEGAFHKGDIGNIRLDAQGRATKELTTDIWAIGGSDTTKNILNKAVVIHGKADDLKSQPAGNAGNRIGCGVVSQQ